MNVVVDTNVFVSGVFFGGVPGRILDYWKLGRMDLLMSEEILSEYVDVLRRLAERYPRIDPDPIVSLVVKKGVFVQPCPLSVQVCVDPDDDKFIAAAIGGHAKSIVSGDQHLVDVSGFQGVVVMRPADFAARFIEDR
jgi:putative PIN family toxin of toxin-antitoxin system